MQRDVRPPDTRIAQSACTTPRTSPEATACDLSIQHLTCQLAGSDRCPISYLLPTAPMYEASSDHLISLTVQHTGRQGSLANWQDRSPDEPEAAMTIRPAGGSQQAG